eukprot:gb/GEZN01011817.1/.p1 GENE.gb/GEZN01011817.1/~~gb/GEZN01011817.1/.p1  ORF type:complete len:242 (-),score=29.17 gb/GEZN01011817.1/:403-1047(-)
MTTMNIVETPSGNFHQECFFCMTCAKEILGEYLTINQTFCHPSCLNCCTCGENLIDQGIMCTEDRKLYCSKDAPRDNCAGCSKALESGQAVQLGDQTWHAACFKCNICTMSLAGQNYMDQKNKFFCKGCYDTHILVRCARCDKEAEGEVFALGNPEEGDTIHFHKKCYSCAQCNTKLQGQGGHVMRGDIYCKKCHVLQIAMYEEESAPNVSEKA